MIVDDHPAFRGLIRAVLQTARCNCIECQDGLEAVETYETSMPDLVLMDLSMERLDGLGATARIKASFPAARIMILTQHDDPHLRAAADKAGACGYILKDDLLGLPAAIAAHTMSTADFPDRDDPLPVQKQ
jgi:DNA-binding NarL/FixJ family response regulator